MALRYVDSNATGAATGADWANAFLSVAAALAIAVGGDFIFVAARHNFLASAVITWTSAAAFNNPVYIVCVDHTGSVPPVSADLRFTASENVNMNNPFSLTAGCGVVQGISLVSGNGGAATSASFNIGTTGNYRWKFEGCAIWLNSTSSGIALNFGANTAAPTGAHIEMNNTTLRFGAVGHGIVVRTPWRWTNTPNALVGANIPLVLIKDVSQGTTVEIRGVDLSAAGSGKTLVGALNACGRVYFDACKFGNGVTVAAQQLTPGAEIYVSNCDAPSTRHIKEKYSYAGTQVAELTILPTNVGQASDGVTPITDRISTFANTSQAFPYFAIPYVEKISVAGSPVTRTFETLFDIGTTGGVPLTNANIWIEVSYLGDSGDTLGLVASTGPADILAAGTTLAASTATWVTTGMGTPDARKIAVTFTPQKIGYYRMTVKVGLQGPKSVYVNPRANEA